MPNYHVKHITRYSYASPVIDCSNQIMLYPVSDNLQQVKEHRISITGNPLIEIFTDYFGNKIGMFTLIQPHHELVITSEAEVETFPHHFPTNETSAEAQWAELDELCNQFPYIDFLQAESFDNLSELENVINQIFDKNKTPFENVKAFSEYIYQNFEYKKGITNVETKVSEIWKLKAGVCQDFAHTLLLMLRKMRIPSRYVSGYICPKNEDDLRGAGATHAWIEAYIPGYGWTGFDPTNNCIVNDQHIKLAIGRNFSDCTPVKGTYKGCSAHQLDVSVIIENGERNKKSKQAKDVLPPVVFTSTSENPTQVSQSNSYRIYIEQMQQQQ
ncbi:hypothetical protein A9P82_13280 [Arachidicoccus ginsenosidimutans]|uniref:transglutaminase family protein n=1 Tax=Arachidicoccus sp. BS20 TaxID=1850526 RepID=UPI0007F155A9|nr:transglutaminase family protein [Arachidicoccus sp. BS20]ANI90172.1 hypothetical protein A9P82_13280 [Arachidicoccus sp. BS20]